MIHVVGEAEEGAALVSSVEYPGVIGQLVQGFSEWYPRVVKVSVQG